MAVLVDMSSRRRSLRCKPEKKERLEAELISAFYRHIDLFLREAAGRGAPGLTEEMLKKTKNYLSATIDPEKDYHDGTSLHRKWKFMKYMNNVLASEWAKILNLNGSLPSGVSMADALLTLRQRIWETEHAKKTPVVPWSQTCEELIEMIAFITLGPPSSKPAPHFDLRRSSGSAVTPAGNEDSTALTAASRKRIAERDTRLERKRRQLEAVDQKRKERSIEEKEAAKVRNLLRNQNAAMKHSLLLKQRQMKIAESQELISLLADDPEEQQKERKKLINLPCAVIPFLW